MTRFLRKSNPLVRLRSLMAGVLMVSATLTQAQMSGGNYTINSGASASSTNFRNWLSFTQALQNFSRSDGGPSFGGAGISGAITVDVQSSLTESTPVTFPAVTGASSTNTITINGGGNFVSYNNTSTSSNKAVIVMNGADWFRFNNLVIRNTGTSAPWGIWFYNQADNNLVEKCTIEFTNYSSATTSTSSGAAYVVFSASVSGLNWSTSTHNGSKDTIRGCLMRTTNSSAPGPYAGIFELNSTSTYSYQESNNTFDGNTIQNFYYYGIYSFYSNGTQIINNDISRVNAGTRMPNTTHMGIRMEYSYSTNRSSMVMSNKIHDLPYTNSTTSTGTAFPYGVYTYYLYGSSSNKAEVSKNEIYNFKMLNYFYGIYNYYNYDANISGNIIRDNASGSTSYSYGMYNYYSQRCNVDENIIKDNDPFSNWYGINYYYASNGTLSGNQLIDNYSYTTSSSYYYHRCMNMYYPTNILISRNSLIGNGTAYYSYVYSYYLYYPTNTQFESNLLAKQKIYYYHYGLYAYNYSNGGNNTIDNNTLDFNYSSPYYYTYNLGLYVGGYSTSGPWKIRGNIIRQTGPDYYTYMCYLYGAQNGYSEVDYNVFHSANTSTLLYFSPVAGGYSGYWPGIVGTVNSVMNTGNAPIGKTNNNLFIDPLFNNISANDYKPNSWKCNNSMPTVTGRDITNALRNPGVSDRGCIERYTDLQATAVTWNAGATPCSNFPEKPSITIKNNFVDTAYDFPVAFRVNGGPKIREIVNTKVLAGNSTTYTFQTPVRLFPGQVKLDVFIDVPDDNNVNDTQSFNMNVRPAPSGGEFTLTQGLNDNRKNMEVTIVNSPVKYTFTPPQYYTNSDYGTSSKWTAKPFARSAGGRDVSSYISLTRTPGAQDGEITFTPTALNDEDSFFTVGIVVNDVGNGCDSVIQRRIYVQPLGRPNFKIPAVNCFGDVTYFENTSTIKNGAMDYVWYFGDGDTSIASNPVHEFKATGTYKVRLATWTTPYGFRNDTVIDVTINAVPAVNFDKLNVCDGGSVTFNNKTIPASPTTYSWDFGDGSKPNTNANPMYSYGKVGSYVVTLTASLNGCDKSFSKNMYVFPKPQAAFTQDAGSCENQLFKFSNQSTVSSGELGFYWDFDDNGTVATLKNAEHDFSSFGTKNVKLKAISEFGCVDSIVKPIDVKAAPTASFSNTAACSITPTTFTNTTAPVTGWTPSYTWNFGDGTNSTAASPVKNWTNLGPKNVTLKVELNNGCSDMVSKLLTVGIQPSAAFSAENTCAGQPMTFVNSTTWPQGDITYLWNFADGNTSNESDPNHVYNVTATRLFNVTLYAYIAGGCADSITKQVIVNEGPKTCDFDADVNYNKGFRGVDFTPKSSTGTGAQAGVNYTWVYDQEGQSNGPAGYNNFQEDGVYRVTMRARNVNGCECVAVKTISINRRGVEDATGLEARINLYPNPNNGMFKVVVGAEAQQDLSIAVYNVLGAKVADVPTNGRNSGTFDVNASELSNGIYLVKITSGGQTAIRKVNIQR